MDFQIGSVGGDAKKGNHLVPKFDGDDVHRTIYPPNGRVVQVVGDTSQGRSGEVDPGRWCNGISFQCPSPFPRPPLHRADAPGAQVCAGELARPVRSDDRDIVRRLRGREPKPAVRRQMLFQLGDT